MNASSTIAFRPATRDDVAAVVQLLAIDDLGKTREIRSDASLTAYLDAFDAIERDPGHEVIVIEDDEGLAGTMQLSYIPNLTFQGATRCQIEGVRIAHRVRDSGLGREMIEWAVARARDKGCRIVQLTSNRTRDGALSFYERLGFQASHVGFKMYLD